MELIALVTQLMLKRCHYISVLTIADRKITHWRDYLDPIAVFHALGWPQTDLTTA